ncbi:GGDEF domain-containing protein [Dictyoglomus turgidum]|uniref:GGDEF domain-containing protein n=1 Tax=Dictyoglomus TaxID=13 RepID=UPI0023533575|nr:GGDEF domain-containing protein [Dictyoglomus turgidum]
MRKRIGVIVNYLYEEYQLKVISGIINTSRKYNIDLFIFVGGNLNYDIENLQRNKIYQLINYKDIDGLIILGLVLGYNIPKEKIIGFYKNFSDIPTVSIGLTVENFPSITIDNSKGFINLLDHLVKDHKYKNFTFVTGPLNNDEAKERYEIFLKIMRENNIEIKDDYIYEGDFSKFSGINAVRTFLDERKLKPDVIVFSNDTMAIGGIEELKRRKIKIPEDIAITGFDNIEESYFITPSLTTVNQPLYELGEKALEICLSIILGEKVKENIVLPTRLIIRESCGHKEEIFNKAIPPSEKKIVNITEAKILKNKFLEFLTEDSQIKKENYELFSKIYDLFFTSLFEKRQIFLEKIHEYLEKNLSTTEELKEIVFLIDSFTKIYLEKDLKKDAETLILKAERIISTYSEKLLRYDQYKTNEEIELLGYIGSDLLSSFRMEDIIERISARLPELNINSFYLVFTDENLKEKKLIFAHLRDENVREEIKLSFDEIIPKKLYPKERKELIVKPLYFQENFFGYMVLEYGPKRGVIYEILRSQISAAIQGAKIFEELNRLAITDPLTQLFNRRYIEEELRKEIERSKRYSRPLSVMVLDLDNFKIINDILGHQYGDEVLKKIGENLKKSCRKVDTVGRFGGDEFVIILPETNLEKSIKVANKIIKNLEKMEIKFPNGEKIYISISIGIASYPETSKDPEKILSLADSAMYNAKRLGGKQYSIASF